MQKHNFPHAGAFSCWLGKAALLQMSCEGRCGRVEGQGGERNHPHHPEWHPHEFHQPTHLPTSTWKLCFSQIEGCFPLKNKLISRLTVCLGLAWHPKTFIGWPWAYFSNLTSLSSHSLGHTKVSPHTVTLIHDAVSYLHLCAQALCSEDLLFQLLLSQTSEICPSCKPQLKCPQKSSDVVDFPQLVTTYFYL